MSRIITWRCRIVHEPYLTGGPSLRIRIMGLRHGVKMRQISSMINSRSVRLSPYSPSQKEHIPRNKRMRVAITVRWQPYNWLLFLKRLVDHADSVVVLDNNALACIAADKCTVTRPSIKPIRLCQLFMAANTQMFLVSVPSYMNFACQWGRFAWHLRVPFSSIKIHTCIAATACYCFPLQCDVFSLRG